MHMKENIRKCWGLTQMIMLLTNCSYSSSLLTGSYRKCSKLVVEPWSVSITACCISVFRWFVHRSSRGRHYGHERPNCQQVLCFSWGSMGSDRGIVIVRQCEIHQLNIRPDLLVVCWLLLAGCPASVCVYEY